MAVSCSPQSLSRNTAIEVASTVKALHNETESLLLGRASLVSEAPYITEPAPIPLLLCYYCSYYCCYYCYHIALS